MPAKNKSNELKLIRVFDAPVQAVWDAWTDLEQVARWWGPRGFTITTHRKDLRPGGIWDYTMHGPDGTDYPNFTTYHEVVERERLVYDHGAAGDGQPPLFRVTALFSEKDGKTTLDFTMKLETAEKAEEIRKFIKKAGGESTWDRLAEFVEKRSSGKEVFVINRSFDAPLSTLVEMWTNPKHLEKWLPPEGMQMEFLRGDIKTGGTTVSRMSGNGLEFYARLQYRAIGPNRIVYTQQFCDKDEKISRHPLAPTWPETMLTTVDFTPEGPERTRVRITWEPHGSVSPAEFEFFFKERGGMTKGWTGSFDKLEALLTEVLECEKTLSVAPDAATL